LPPPGGQRQPPQQAAHIQNIGRPTSPAVYSGREQLADAVSDLFGPSERDTLRY
jgi:hypothetical protein